MVRFTSCSPPRGVKGRQSFKEGAVKNGFLFFFLMFLRGRGAFFHASCFFWSRNGGRGSVTDESIETGGFHRCYTPTATCVSMQNVIGDVA